MFDQWISSGIFYGYSDASIIHFVRYMVDPDYTAPNVPENGKLRGTGLVLPPEESELTEEEILAAINERRIVPEPFPQGKWGKYTHADRLRFMNDPRFLERYIHIEAVLKNTYGLPKRKSQVVKQQKESGDV